MFSLASTVAAFNVGGTHPDTSAPKDDRTTVLAGRDLSTLKVTRIDVSHSKFVQGLQVYYRDQTNGVEIVGGRNFGSDSTGARVDSFILSDDEFIVTVRGGAGGIVDRVEFVTNKGRAQAFGGTGGNAYEWKAPFLHHFNNFIVATNGHIHNIHATPVPINGTHRGAPGVNQYANAPAAGTRKSAVIGGANPDSKYFDDFYDLVHYATEPSRISSVTVWYDSNYVYGLQATYAGATAQVAGPRHLGSDAAKFPTQQQTINLAAGERITEISGRGGNIIDHLRLTTSNGQIIEAGGAGGNPFANIVTGEIRAIGGATNGHLHNLYVHLV